MVLTIGPNDVIEQHNFYSKNTVEVLAKQLMLSREEDI